MNGKGEALVTYTVGGAQKHLLVWGAVNAKPPTKGGKQVEFKLDYSGGYDKYKTTYWKTFGSTCQPYNGPCARLAGEGMQGARRLLLGPSGNGSGS